MKSKFCSSLCHESQPTFTWEYSNLTNNEYEGLSQSVDWQLPPQDLTSLNITVWPVMSATGNNQPQGHPPVFSAETVLLKIVTVALLCRPASHCKWCWNQCRRCPSGALHWHHLKAVCSAPKAFSEVYCPLHHPWDIVMIQGSCCFSSLQNSVHHLTKLLLLMPVQLSLFSLLLNGRMFASIQ